VFYLVYISGIKFRNGLLCVLLPVLFVSVFFMTAYTTVSYMIFPDEPDCELTIGKTYRILDEHNDFDRELPENELNAMSDMLPEVFIAPLSPYTPVNGHFSSVPSRHFDIIVPPPKPGLA
jgi:hypothetical protein